MQAGPSYSDFRATPALFLEATFDEHSFADTRLAWTPDISLGWIRGRAIDKYRDNGYGVKEDVLLGAAGVRFYCGRQDGSGCRRLFFSFQLALQAGRSMALSTHYEFVSTVGWQWRVASLQLRHVSNGGTGGPNRGETMVLFGVRF